MDMAFTTRPFAFDRIFAPGAPVPPDERDPLSLAIEVEALRSELSQLRADQQAELARARSDAFQAGLDHARSNRDTALLAALDALQAGVERIDTELDMMRATTAQDAARLALATARHIAANPLLTAPAQAIDEAIGRVLTQVARGTELMVRAHPDLLPDIETRIAERQAGDRRRLRLHVRADPAVPLGDARIEWDAGSLTLDRAGREGRVIAEFDALLEESATPGKNFPPAEPAA